MTDGNNHVDMKIQFLDRITDIPKLNHEFSSPKDIAAERFFHPKNSKHIKIIKSAKFKSVDFTNFANTQNRLQTEIDAKPIVKLSFKKPKFSLQNSPANTPKIFAINTTESDDLMPANSMKSHIINFNDITPQRSKKGTPEKIRVRPKLSLTVDRWQSPILPNQIESTKNTLFPPTELGIRLNQPRLSSGGNTPPRSQKASKKSIISFEDFIISSPSPRDYHKRSITSTKEVNSTLSPEMVNIYQFPARKSSKFQPSQINQIDIPEDAKSPHASVKMLAGLLQKPQKDSTKRLLSVRDWRKKVLQKTPKKTDSSRVMTTSGNIRDFY